MNSLLSCNTCVDARGLSPEKILLADAFYFRSSGKQLVSMVPSEQIFVGIVRCPLKWREECTPQF